MEQILQNHISKLQNILKYFFNITKRKRKLIKYATRKEIEKKLFSETFSQRYTIDFSTQKKNLYFFFHYVL